MENSPPKTPAALEKTREASRVIRAKMVTYIAAGMAFVIGLAWNEAISGVITYFYPDKGNTVVAKLVYAVSITIVISVFLYLVEKSVEDKDK